MHCPECGQEILAGSEFCGNCGAPVTRQQAGPVCANCGSPNQPGAEFCAECGARLGGEVIPMQSFCPECGAAVKEGAAFCKECGADLNATTAPAPFVCPECGEPLPPDAAFCGNCGQVLQQGAEYAPAVPEAAATGNVQSFQPQGWEPIQEQQQGWAQQPQGRDYSQQQDWSQPQQQNWASQSQVKTQPQKSGMRKILFAAAAAVVLLVIGITGFWKPGFLLDLFRPTAKLENGILALKDISLDFKQTNLKNGAATLTIVKDKEEEVHNGLIGDLYVMKFDKSCQGKVTVSVPVPKGFKPTTSNGLYIKLGIGRDYALAGGKTARFYEYFDATIKDGKAIAVIDPAASGRSRHKFKTSAETVEKKSPDVGGFTEYMGWFFKEGWYNEGEGFNYEKGHFRLWYNYNLGQQVSQLRLPFMDQKPTLVKPEDAKAMLNDLEEAYNYFKTHGYEKHVDSYTPIDVYITRCKDEGGWNNVSGNMELKESSAFGANYNERYEGENRKKTKTTMYHEFFHAIQQSFIGTVDAALDTKNSGWFDEATATYFERVVNPGKYSDNEQAQFWRLWQGPIPKNNTPEDGYARSLLIRFMSKKLLGDEWIKTCYEHWSSDYYQLKKFMKLLAPDDASFAAKFYLEVAKGFGPHPPGSYYKLSQKSLAYQEKNATYLSAIRIELDKETKEKLAKGEIGKEPIEFTSPTFEIEGYGGHIVALVTQDGDGDNAVNLTKDFPDGCQLSLSAPGCRVQVIRFQTGGNKSVDSSDKSVITNFTEQIKKKYLYLALVTSTQPTKQKVALKATLELLKEGIYNGKATMTRGKKSYTVNNKVGFRLSLGKDGRWGLNICQANGDNIGSGPNVPLIYDAKQKIWTGHRKFKEELSKDPKKSKAEVSTVDCTMKVNAEGKEPILIIDYKVDIAKLYIDYNFRGDESFKVHFEGKWSSDLKGKTLPSGKITILE